MKADTEGQEDSNNGYSTETCFYASGQLSFNDVFSF